jgi:hypothetical protein
VFLVLDWEEHTMFRYEIYDLDVEVFDSEGNLIVSIAKEDWEYFANVVQAANDTLRTRHL